MGLLIKKVGESRKVTVKPGEVETLSNSYDLIQEGIIVDSALTLSMQTMQQQSVRQPFSKAAFGQMQSQLGYCDVDVDIDEDFNFEFESSSKLPRP